MTPKKITPPPPPVLTDTPSEHPPGEMERFRILNDLAMELTAGHHLEQKLQLVADKSRRVLEADICLISLRNQSSTGYIIHTVSGSGADSLRDMELPTEAPLFRQATDPSHASPVPAREKKPLDVATGIAVPLQVSNTPLGFLFAGRRAWHEFSQTDRCILSLIGNLAAAEIHRNRSQETQIRLETILEQAAESIMVTNAKGIIQYVNPAFENITGYSSAEAVGQSPRFLKSGRHDQAFYIELWDTLRRGKVWRGHFTNKRKNGELYDLEATISPIKNSDGDITHYVSVRNDVTQTNHLERQLRHAQKMEAIGTLAGGIAHDFNNLLMGIQGNISLMLFQMSPADPYAEKCKTIEKHIQKGADLTRQLLGLARDGKYQAKPLDLNQFIRDSLDVFGRTRKEIKIHARFSSEPCVAVVDPSQIDQVLLNLLVNAWQAMPNGGELYIKTRRITLPDTSPMELTPGTYILITVTDTGPGIDAAIQDRIFDPFFTTKQKQRGTGLGLASSYGIMKNHGGMIAVQSEKGKGSTFQLYLPASPHAAVSTKARPSRITYGNETVLLVDDESPVLEITRQLLEQLGYRVLAADSGRAALGIYKEKKAEIALVILDMIMPELSGLETFERLRQIDPAVAVLLTSGYTMDGEGEKILSMGCKGFIRKPHDIKQLSEKITEILNT